MGRQKLDEIPSEIPSPIPPDAPPSLVGITVKSLTLDFIPIIDNSTGTIRYNQLPSGRYLNFSFGNDDFELATVSCLDLNTYGFSSNNLLSFHLPSSNSIEVLSFSCTYNNVDFTLELEVLPSAITLVSSSPIPSVTGAATAFAPQISDDGKWVVFESWGLSSSSKRQIVRKNLITQVYDIVSVGQGGTLGNGTSNYHQISSDGRWVVFKSLSTNFATGASGPQIYLKDMTSPSTSPILISSNDSLNSNQATVMGNSNSLIVLSYRPLMKIW